LLRLNAIHFSTSSPASLCASNAGMASSSATIPRGSCEKQLEKESSNWRRWSEEVVVWVRMCE
jgi:hypothetical protein